MNPYIKPTFIVTSSTMLTFCATAAMNGQNLIPYVYGLGPNDTFRVQTQQMEPDANENFVIDPSGVKDQLFQAITKAFPAQGGVAGVQRFIDFITATETGENCMLPEPIENALLEAMSRERADDILSGIHILMNIIEDLIGLAETAQGMSAEEYMEVTGRLLNPPDQITAEEVVTYLDTLQDQREERRKRRCEIDETLRRIADIPREERTEEEQKTYRMAMTEIMTLLPGVQAAHKGGLPPVDEATALLPQRGQVHRSDGQNGNDEEVAE